MRPQRRDSTLHPFDHRRVNRHPDTVSAHLQDDWLIYARVLTSVEEIADTALMVVGPDEPFDRHSQQDMEADHWASLAAVLRHQGVDTDAVELGRLPHDVVLGEQLLARIGHQPGEGIQS